MPTLAETMRAVLALEREAGTEAAREARRLVSTHLASLGFVVEEQRFTFHRSALNGLPVFGAGLGGLALVVLPLLTSPRGPPVGATLVSLGGIATLAIVAVGIGLGWVPLGDAPVEDANIIATSGTPQPRRWIVAHLDTKAQKQSMAGRIVAVWALGIAVALLVGLSLVRLGGPVPLVAGAIGAILSIAAGALATRGRLSGRTPGARDNGTGVAAALAAAERLAQRRTGDTGVLITGAEEFGLVGARIFAATRPERLRDAVIINLDTIDDAGQLALVCHDSAGLALARREAVRVAGLGLGTRVRRLPVGILTDSVPFARRGLPAITIGRLTWGTLRVIHTAADTADGLDLGMAVAVGEALV